MKLQIITLLLLFSFNASAYFENVSFGLGTLSENIAEVQSEDSVDGSTNTLEFNPYFNMKTMSEFYFGLDYHLEAGITLPRSSRDEAVDRLNYWFNFLISKRVGILQPEFGLGFFFTRLSMDGEPQYLSNGNDSSVEFSTPSGAVVATNNVIILGLGIHTITQWYFNIQSVFLNIEDSQERSVNILMSVNYKFNGTWN